MVTMLVLAVLVAVPASDVSEAAEGYDDVYYCYGDTATFQHPIDEAEPSWEYSKDGGPVQTSDERVLSVPIDDCDTLSITQHLRGTEKTILVHSMHVTDDEDELFTITFHDGGSVLPVERQLDRTSAIREGDLFVMPVDDLTKDGYVFGGWYTSPTFAEGTEFDPRDPVEDDMDVYALWTASGSGSNTTTPDRINTTHVVTFDTEFGLEYDIVSSSATSVTFTVSVVGGFELRDGTLSVTSNGGSIEGSDGTYTLTGIDRDIVVTISGDVTSILDPGGIDDEIIEDPTDGGFPWWIVIVVIIIVAIVAAVAYMRLRGGA